MRILLVEDEPDLAVPLAELLRRNRYEVDWERDATGAYERLGARDFELALLDIMLPEGEDAGLLLAQDMRSAGYSGQILFLTARDSVADRVEGLDAGGDDYLVKPFSFEELLARVRALLRRDSQVRQAVFERGPLRVEFNARRLFWGGREARLSDREFAMIELFALNPDRVFTVAELLDRFFPDADSGPQVIRVYIWQLRSKVDGRLLVTVPGGYRLGSSA
mgnify:CR=1 FL=1